LKIEIVTGDSLAWLKKQKALSYDVASFSPPYGKGRQFLFNVASKDWTQRFAEWAVELSRVCRVWGVDFTQLVDDKTKGCIPFTERLVVDLHDAGVHLFDRWVMYKTATRPMRGNKALSAFEFFLLFSAEPAKVPLNEGRWLTAFKEESARAVDFNHSPKLGQRAYSQAFPRAIIQAHCPPKGRVLDAFSGSGTTGLVAKSLGCSFTGVELDPEVADLSRKVLGIVR
jgi:DNA modification methylase